MKEGNDTRLSGVGLVLVFVLLFSSMVCSGKGMQDSVRQGFYRLSASYEDGDIGDTAYLNQTYHYAQLLLANGVLLSDEEMLRYLSLFRKIAWSDRSYGNYKESYYAILANQAQMANRGGAMLYYAEKLENVAKEQRKPLSMAALTIKSDFYRAHQSYSKVKELYLSHRMVLHAIPGLPAREADPRKLVQTMIYLEKTGEATAKLFDTVTTNEIYGLMIRIAAVIRLRYSLEPIYNAYAAFCLARTQGQRAIAAKKPEQCLPALALLDSLAHDPATPDVLVNYAQQAFTEMKIAYFLDVKNADSLLYWLGVYEHSPNVGQDNDTRYFREHMRAEAYLAKGDYARSVGPLHEAIRLLQASNTETLEDIDGMLYAHAQAEEKGIALAASAQTVQRRTFLAFAIGMVSVCIIASLLIFFHRSRRVLRGRIAQLDNSIELQIVSLEEVRLIAQREEQRQISRELHDEWSPGLASVLHQVGFIEQDTSDDAIRPALNNLYAQVAQTYESLRNFSHRLYGVGEGLEDGLFEQRIKTIVHQALPDNRFVKHIHIAEGTMQHVDLDKRIALLRIIREAIVNIIKHAAASEVTIMLYEEAGQITLTVADNGKGFDAADKAGQRGKGIGLHSITERVHELDGTLDIKSGKDGTAVHAVFPVSLH